MYNDTRHKLKLTPEQFKQYLLDHYLDEDNSKIPERKLVCTAEFMEETGLYKLDKRTGIRTPISMGTMAYWKKKLNLKDYEVYKYHRNVTKRITVEYQDWTVARQKTREKKSKLNSVKGAIIYTPELEKERLVRECAFPKYFVNYSLERLRDLAYELWDTLELDPQAELAKIQRSIMLGQSSLEGKRRKKKQSKRKRKGD